MRGRVSTCGRLWIRVAIDRRMDMEIAGFFSLPVPPCSPLVGLSSGVVMLLLGEGGTLFPRSCDLSLVSSSPWRCFVSPTITRRCITIADFREYIVCTRCLLIGLAREER